MFVGSCSVVCLFVCLFGGVQAATTYAQLLNTQSDNNVKLIVLERLAGLKKHHAKVSSSGRNSIVVVVVVVASVVFVVAF